MKEFNSRPSDLFKRISCYQDFAFLLLLTILVVGLYHQALRGWWTHDDPFILTQSIQHYPWEFFFNPHVWQQFSNNNLTPLVSLSFDIDVALFGLNPLWFYVHQLFILWLVVIVLYFVLLLYVPSTFAAMGSALFVVGAPVTEIATQLMTRHYLEGMMLALIAMYLFVKALRTKMIVLAWISGLVYILAMSAKEVYVPLVLAVLALPENTWRIRFKYATPLLLAFIFYIPWRMWMLGEAAGGPGSIVKTQDLLLLTSKILQPLFNCNTIWGVLTAFIVLGIVFGMSWRRWHVFFYTIWMGILVLIPIVPLAPGGLHFRYVFVIWATLCVGVSIGLFNLWRSTAWRIFVVSPMWVIMILTTVINSNNHMTNYVEGMYRWKAEGKFVLEETGAEKLLVEPKGPPWFYDYLMLLRQEVFKRPKGPSVVYNDIFFLDNDIVGQSVWTYSNGYIIDATSSVADSIKKLRGRLHPEAPLSVKVDFEGEKVSWQLGPYHNGKYFALMGKVLFPLSIRREDTKKVRLPFITTFRIRYNSPEGWITYSPPFIISSEERSVIWKR